MLGDKKGKIRPLEEGVATESTLYSAFNELGSMNHVLGTTDATAPVNPDADANIAARLRAVLIALATNGIAFKNSSDARINPATEEKQDQIITALGGGALIKNIDEAPPYTYIGEAAVGTATSAAAWRIKRVDDTSDPDATILYAGTGAFDQVYDDRVGLTYN